MADNVLAWDILSCMSELVFARDPEKNIIYMNKRAEQVTGWTSGEAVKTKKCYEVFGDLKGRCNSSCPIDSFPENRSAVYPFEKFIRTREGRLLSFRVSVSPLVLEGRIGGGIVVMEEIDRFRECTNLHPKTAGQILERALRESEEKYRLLLENIEDGFYEVDLAGNLLYCNDSMARIYGVEDRFSVKGINYRDYMDKENAEAVYQAYNRVFCTGNPEKGFSLEIRRNDGNKRILEVSVSLVRDGDGRPAGFRGIVRDITERRQAEERLKFLSMHDIMTGLYNRMYFEEEMSRLNRGRFSPVTIICCDVDWLKLVNDTFGHKRGDDLLKSVAEILKEPFRASDLVARVGGDEFAVILPRTGEAAAQKICDRIQQAIERYNMKGADIPISLSVGKSTGIISKELNCHELFRRADNDMYRQKLHTKANSRSILLSWLVKTLDDRDFMAGGHDRKVFEYAKRLGEAAGLSSGEINDLKLLSRFHDIGKVGISDAVLLKPGYLNKKEWEEIRQHSEIGFRMARSIPELYSIADFILYHHEWWNGKGYPLGLSGREIPLNCRVFAIAEAYAVMTSDRPYREAMKADEALRELVRCSETQFDPQLVELFVRITNENDQN